MPRSRLASRGGHRAGRWPLGAGRPAWARPAPGPGARSPGSASGSPRGSGAARPDSSGHAAAVDTRPPHRSTGVPRGADGDGRASGRTDSVGVGDAVRLRASITSQVEATRYSIWGAGAQDGSGVVSRTAPRQASSTEEPPDAEPLTVTTAVVVKGDDVDGGAARLAPRRQGRRSGAWGRGAPASDPSGLSAPGLSAP